MDNRLVDRASVRGVDVGQVAIADNAFSLSCEGRKSAALLLARLQEIRAKISGCDLSSGETPVKPPEPNSLNHILGNTAAAIESCHHEVNEIYVALGI